MLFVNLYVFNSNSTHLQSKFSHLFDTWGNYCSVSIFICMQMSWHACDYYIDEPKIFSKLMSDVQIIARSSIKETNFYISKMYWYWLHGKRLFAMYIKCSFASQYMLSTCEIKSFWFLYLSRLVETERQFTILYKIYKKTRLTKFKLE